MAYQGRPPTLLVSRKRLSNATCFKYKISLFIRRGPVSIRKVRRDRRLGLPAITPMKTSDGHFSYEAAGDPARPPLVFLHGIGGAARAWRGQLEAFGDRYRAIAWDMPGYGGARAPARGRSRTRA